MKRKNDSQRFQDEINQNLKETGWKRRDFLRATGASILAGMGAILAPGILRAAVQPRYYKDSLSLGQTLTTLPSWKPYPYEIVPIHVLDATVPKALFTYLMNYDKVVTIGYGAFFISGVKGHNILIDSGPTEEDLISKGFPPKVRKPMREALKDATGLSPEDIDILIQTQLHHDHTPLTGIYKNAKVIVQKTEWNSMHNPPACYRGAYNPEYIIGVIPTFVHGDVFNLFPGVSLMYTPGHTIGTQSVVVDTKEGRVVFCGTCCLEENFTPPAEVRRFWPDVLVPGLIVDTQQAYESLAKIKREADYIITPHDKLHFDRGVCPSPKWPKLGTRVASFETYRSDAPKSHYSSVD